MSFFEILFLSIALAMDAFAVAIACGFILKKTAIRHCLRIAVFFAVFQSVMPVIGWLLTGKFQRWLKGIDHWIAFALLFLIGAKMMREGFLDDEDQPGMDPLETGTLLVLAVATSIDALAAGISFSLLEIEILLPVLLIGLVTFVFSFAGVKIGSRYGHYLEQKVKIFGGLVLVLLGIKILAEHLIS